MLASIPPSAEAAAVGAICGGVPCFFAGIFPFLLSLLDSLQLSLGGRSFPFAVHKPVSASKMASSFTSTWPASITAVQLVPAFSLSWGSLSIAAAACVSVPHLVPSISPSKAPLPSAP
ncbi:hypothetical protein XELAEV_18004137mg [Xenopus laevis]|uniref:Uncharacterized protein n=1 Tax=Xenopus laevis TaxID=8355 RepID=A0A974BPA7_XENLA|nr:hypothetical protein XELAEV_18004137mg [Xenopus laevis]